MVLKSVLSRLARSYLAAPPEQGPREPRQPGQPPYRYLGNRSALVQLHDGSHFVVDTDSLDISVSLMVHGRWEPWIEPHITDVLAPGSVFVDAGANMGYYSVIAGRVVGASGFVHAFEPNPRLHELLAKNLSINGLAGRAHACALGSRPGRARLWTSRNAAGGGYITNDPAADATASGLVPVEVEVRTLDGALAEVPEVHVMKIDVEGFEPEVLAGARATIERSRRLRLVIELSPSGWAGQGHSAKEVLDGLGQLGFRFRLLLPEGARAMSVAELLSTAETLPYVTCISAERAS
ncbi:FkbM family methyltransferase [Arenibaculum pallidiluteum]|uniref:FkbM family methyltransferase n=1 Tax=Arenibaculum pallidiluteum TaxID=2812559 RepID=UPI001A95B74A|nr:FkbM family methyltransferase [Arenibaculum pallidiluteum]